MSSAFDTIRGTKEGFVLLENHLEPLHARIQRQGFYRRRIKHL